MSKISIQMDPIELIDIKADTTFALTLEAFKRGHDLFYYNPKDLTFNNGTITAKGNNILNIKNTINEHVQLSELETKHLSSEDVILLRQDPPFDMTYITNTHILETLHPNTFVVNNPCLLYTSPSPRDQRGSRMPSSA